MFDVLAFVYDHYQIPDVHTEPALLQQQLRRVGFAPEDIGQALVWLQGLHGATTHPCDATRPAQAAGLLAEPGPASVRIYPARERRHLGNQCIGYLHFLEQAGIVSPTQREIVIERALAAPGGPVPLDELKFMVLLMFWSLGQDPGPLVVDELCTPAAARALH